MTDPAIVSAAASVVSAIAASVAAGGIWHGIRAMVRANKDRAGILDQQREADERRHTEAMQAGDQRHAETMAALADQRRALETLIARTAPAPTLRRNRPLLRQRGAP